MNNMPKLVMITESTDIYFSSFSWHINQIYYSILSFINQWDFSKYLHFLRIKFVTQMTKGSSNLLNGYMKIGLQLCLAFVILTQIYFLHKVNMSEYSTILRKILCLLLCNTIALSLNLGFKLLAEKRYKSISLCFKIY